MPLSFVTIFQTFFQLLYKWVFLTPLPLSCWIQQLIHQASACSSVPIASGHFLLLHIFLRNIKLIHSHDISLSSSMGTSDPSPSSKSDLAAAASLSDVCLFLSTNYICNFLLIHTFFQKQKTDSFT